MKQARRSRVEEGGEQQAEGETEDVEADKIFGEDGGYASLLKTAQGSAATYDSVNSAEGIVPWGRDSNR